MGMEVKTALDKFYNIFDNPQKYGLFFYCNGLGYQLSSGGYIVTGREIDQRNSFWIAAGVIENGLTLQGGDSIYGILDTAFAAI